MSHDMGIRCQSCDEQIIFDNSKMGKAFMKELIRHAKALADLDDFIYELKCGPYGYIDTGFFKKHLSHKLVVIDEYGKVYESV